ncbi:pentatricopeptide repeat domain-containing protein, partial [Spizellomyces punctatus DAOM BR117]
MRYERDLRQHTFAHRCLRLSNSLRTQSPALAALLSFAAHASVQQVAGYAAFPRSTQRQYVAVPRVNICNGCRREASFSIKYRSSHSASAQSIEGETAYPRYLVNHESLVTSFVREVEEVSRARFLPFFEDALSREAARLHANYCYLRSPSGSETACGSLLRSLTLKDFRALIGLLLRAGNISSKDIGMIMEDMVALGIQPHALDWGRLIVAFGRNHDVKGALRVFDRVRDTMKPDSSCWNGVIEAFVHARDPAGAERWYREMKKTKTSVTEVTLVLMIEVYERARDLKMAEKYWAIMNQRLGIIQKNENHRDSSAKRPPNLRTFNRLIKLACDRGRMDRAMDLYNSMVKCGQKPNIGTFTLLLKGYVEKGDVNSAGKVHRLLRYMNVKPDLVFYSLLLSVHAKRGHMREVGRLLNRLYEDGIQPDVGVYNILINGYGRTGRLNNVREFYTAMLNQRLVPDRWTFAALISAHVKAGDVDGAKSWFDEGLSAWKSGNEGASLEPSAYAYTSLLDAYGRRGELQLCRQLFSEMLSAGVKPTVATYTALINAHISGNDVQGATRWFQAMQSSGMSPDALLYAVIVRSFAAQNDFDRAMQWMASRKIDGITLTEESGAVFIKTCLAQQDVAAALEIFVEATETGVVLPSMIYEALVRRLADKFVSGEEERLTDTEGMNEQIVNHKGEPPDSEQFLTSRNAICSVYAQYRKVLSQLDSSPNPLIYETMVGYFMAARMHGEAKEVIRNMIEDGCPITPRAPVQIIRGLATAEGWWAVRTWLTGLRRWIHEMSVKAFACRTDNDEGLQILWREGLIHPDFTDSLNTADGEGTISSLKFDAWKVDRVLTACEAFTFGMYALWPLVSNLHHVKDVKRDFIVVNKARAKPDAERFMLEWGAVEYWDAILSLWTLVDAKTKSKASKKSGLHKQLDCVAAPPCEQTNVNQSETRVTEIVFPASFKELPVTEQPVYVPKSPNLSNPLEMDLLLATFIQAFLRHCEMNGTWGARKKALDWLLENEWEVRAESSRGGYLAQD